MHLWSSKTIDVRDKQTIMFKVSTQGNMEIIACGWLYFVDDPTVRNESFSSWSDKVTRIMG